MEKGKVTQMLSWEVQTRPPCLPNLLCGLGAAGSDVAKRRNTKSKEVLPLIYGVQSRSPCFLNY